MKSIVDIKNNLRKEYFEEYKKNKNKDYYLYSILKKKIFNYFQYLKRYNRKKQLKVMVYWPFKSELPILSLLNYSFLELYYPQKRDQMLIPVKFSQKLSIILKKEYTEKRHNLSQAHLTKKITIKQLDYIVIPGLYVDTKGNRLGRGRGYYDRTLRYFPKNKTIFIARDWQVKNNIPVISTDKSIRTIITETRIIRNN